MIRLLALKKLYRLRLLPRGRIAKPRSMYKHIFGQSVNIQNSFPILNIKSIKVPPQVLLLKPLKITPKLPILCQPAAYPTKAYSNHIPKHISLLSSRFILELS